MIEGRGRTVKFVSALNYYTVPSREFVTAKKKNHSEGIDTFDIGVQCVQFSAKSPKKLALYLAELSPSIV